MSLKDRTSYKNAIGCAAVLLVFGWLTVLTLRPNRNDEDHVKIDRLGRQRRSLGESPQANGGAIYVRWGRKECPTDADLVYKGFAGGSHYTQEGGGGNYVCLSDTPKYANTHPGEQANAVIYGAELQIFNGVDLFDKGGSSPIGLHDSDVQCAVCRSQSRPSVVMIPGTTDCPGNDWNKEYWGYLMTEHYGHKASRDFVCVDHLPDKGTEGGFKNEDGALMYHVEGRCGSLPCQPYKQGFELSCVVCTR